MIACMGGEYSDQRDGERQNRLPCVVDRQTRDPVDHDGADEACQANERLARLIMPIGLALSDIDQTLINNLNSFGGRRGYVAHTSRVGVTNILDPMTEKLLVDDIITGLQDLDQKITQLGTSE